MDLIFFCFNYMNLLFFYMVLNDVDILMVYVGLVLVSVGGDSFGGFIIVELLLLEFFICVGVEFFGEVGGFYCSNNNVYGVNFKVSYFIDIILLSYFGSWSNVNNYRVVDKFKFQIVSGCLGY